MTIESGPFFRAGSLALALTASAFIFVAESPAADDGKPRPWSFGPLPAEPLPLPETKGEAATRIDRFLLAKIEEGGLEPAPRADDRTLVRRLHFDLVGLPPTPEEVANFDGDVAALVDRLLESPHYGERWGRHWLDLARYTDTTASWLKSTADAWLYRDWVVAALNDDVPYDDFVRRQLATDLLPATGPEDHAALGLFGLSPTYWKELQLPPEIIKGTVADEWEEHVDALGKTFLGLTLGCARCHDHKNDPVSTRDYYAIAGVFASIRMTDRPTISKELYAPVAEAKDKVAVLEKKVADLKKKKPENWEAETGRLKERIREIADATPHYHVPMANGIVDAALFVKPKENGKHGTTLDYRMGEARDLPVHERGDPNTPGEVVPRGFLSAFPKGPGEEVRRFDRGSGRLDLAEALVTEAAPLTARVFVNRVWRHHFGRGLVSTPSDFGNGGEPPTHPDLLDDLTRRFVDRGWSMKWLHREILGTEAWQRASAHPASESADPVNRLYARMSRRRLDVESWRDSLLFASGSLDPAIGGKPADLASAENRRRTLYGKVQRRDLDSMLRLHDFPDPTAHSPKRPETTTPLQALFSLNSPFFQARAAELADDLRRAGSDVDARIDRAYSRLFQREPTPAEARLARDLVDGDEDGWSLFAHALLASNEFLFVD
ncbi:MAG: DUF1549 and DUF1553 domain-containing protein [Verrucomicrobiales bacterium]